MWRCLCDCGNDCITSTDVLTRKKGINARFNCFMKPFPYCNDIDTSNPEIIEIIFKDSYEIDNLIDVLEKFKKECFEHLGEWR